MTSSKMFTLLFLIVACSLLISETSAQYYGYGYGSYPSSYYGSYGYGGYGYGGYASPYYGGYYGGYYGKREAGFGPQQRGDRYYTFLFLIVSCSLLSAPISAQYYGYVGYYPYSYYGGYGYGVGYGYPYYSSGYYGIYRKREAGFGQKQETKEETKRT